MCPTNSDLRNEFFDDSCALKELAFSRWSVHSGVIRPRKGVEKATDEESTAIAYLCEEWDYGYSPDEEGPPECPATTAAAEDAKPDASLSSTQTTICDHLLVDVVRSPGGQTPG